MMNGIVRENGKLIYYRNGVPYHAGAIIIDGDIYYVGRHGRVATGEHIVHGEMTNGIINHGTYRFDENGKLIKGSYIAPSKKRRKHRKRRSKPVSRRRKIKKPKKKTVILMSVVAAILIAFVTVSVIVDNRLHSSEGSADVLNSWIDVESYEEPVWLCSGAVGKLQTGDCTIGQVAGSTAYKGFDFKYGIKEDGTLYLSESSDLNNADKYLLSCDRTTLTIDNLKTGTDYYYKVEVGDQYTTGSFTTAEGVRFVSIEGARNTRDIGGYKTTSGATVKQGMIIRGTEVDGLVEGSYYISDESAKEAMKTFGFKYEMDLRGYDIFVGEYTSRFGAEVEHKFYVAPSYGNIFSKSNYVALRSMFSDLADEENYPMYMHCTYGADRTGTLVYLLQGVLGVSEDDMMNEYRLTAFDYKNYANHMSIQSISSGLKDYNGNNLSEKIEDFLVNEVGVEKSDLESIRDILLEE